MPDVLLHSDRDTGFACQQEQSGLHTVQLLEQCNVFILVHMYLCCGRRFGKATIPPANYTPDTPW